MDEVYKQFLHLLNTCGEDHISMGSDIDGAPIERVNVFIADQLRVGHDAFVKMLKESLESEEEVKED